MQPEVSSGEGSLVYLACRRPRREQAENHTEIIIRLNLSTPLVGVNTYPCELSAGRLDRIAVSFQRAGTAHVRRRADENIDVFETHSVSELNR